jgi:hypothetical protein
MLFVRMWCGTRQRWILKQHAEFLGVPARHFLLPGASTGRPGDGQQECRLLESGNPLPQVVRQHDQLAEADVARFSPRLDAESPGEHLDAGASSSGLGVDLNVLFDQQQRDAQSFRFRECLGGPAARGVLQVVVQAVNLFSDTEDKSASCRAGTEPRAASFHPPWLWQTYDPCLNSERHGLSPATPTCPNRMLLEYASHKTGAECTDAFVRALA